MAWARGLVRREGLLRSLVIGVGTLAGVVVDYLPSRRRMRYGDIDYDFDNRVNTTWAQPSLAVRLREVFTRGKYMPSEPEVFHAIVGGLGIEYERFTFVDLGSGKGRTLLMASDYPFKKIVGAEIIPELHATGLVNLVKYKSEAQKCFSIEAWLGDAREFPLPPGPLVVYLFNPFPADVLREVLERIQALAGSYVIYHNLVHPDVFEEMTWLERLSGNERWTVFRVRGERKR
jgi:hypothetical protein